MEIFAPWRKRKRSELEHGVENLSFTLDEEGIQGGEGGKAYRASLQQEQLEMA